MGIGMLIMIGMAPRIIAMKNGTKKEDLPAGATLKPNPKHKICPSFPHQDARHLSLSLIFNNFPGVEKRPQTS
jgi:hypothetical protein